MGAACYLLFIQMLPDSISELAEWQCTQPRRGEPQTACAHADRVHCRRRRTPAGKWVGERERGTRGWGIAAARPMLMQAAHARQVTWGGKET